MNMKNFADIEDLRAFTDLPEKSDVARATALLKYASNYLRQIGKNNGVDIDQKIKESADGVYCDSVKLVTLAAVKRALLTPTDAPPANQWSQSASPYAETMVFTNPSNDIFFKQAELQLIGLSSVAGRSKFGLIRGAR